MRTTGIRLALLLGLSAGRCLAASQAIFDQDQNQWTLNNGLIRAVFQLTPEGYFLTREISDLQSGDRWSASATRPSSPIRLQTDQDVFDASTAFQFLAQEVRVLTAPAGVWQCITLQDLNHRAQITVTFELYDSQPILRFGLRYKNLTGSPRHITSMNMVPWTFDDLGRRYTAFRVNQWSVVGKTGDFETSQSLLDSAGTAVEVYSGADGQQCSWLAVRDSEQRGLFAGWEFDGRTKTTVRQMASKGYVQFSSTVLDLNHPVEPEGEFRTPNAFAGVFHGDWDE